MYGQTLSAAELRQGIIAAGHGGESLPLATVDELEKGLSEYALWMGVTPREIAEGLQSLIDMGLQPITVATRDGAVYAIVAMTS